MMRRSYALGLRCCFGISACLLAGALVGCGGGPRAVRGDDVAGLDDQAMGTGLDRRDLQKMLNENMQVLQGSALIARWQREETPTVAVLPIRNETSEHIDSGLQALISDVETQLINAGHVRVISLENQQRLLEEVRRQYSDGYDQAQIATWGRQIGARYIITGKVFSTAERMSGERRVQYYMFMQALSVETGEILFQNRSSVTKAIVR